MTTMTPSAVKTTTQGQIDKAVANYRALLEKHASEFESSAVQTVLGQPEFAEAQFALFRTHVESATGRVIAPNGIVMPEGTIVRHAHVDRTRASQEVIDATGRAKHVDLAVLATMPLGEGDEVDVHFIPTKRLVLASEVAALLAQYGLVPDSRAQAAINEADPAFADKYPNGTQWGNNCYLAFSRWRGERYVRCRRDGSGWLGSWFLSGVPAPRK